MATVLQVIEVIDGQALSQSRDGARGRTRAYMVETDGTISLDELMSASDGVTSIPEWGDPYISPEGVLDASILASDKRVSCRAPTVYRVEVSYESQTLAAGSGAVPPGGAAKFGEGGLDSLSGTAGADGTGTGEYAPPEGGGPTTGGEAGGPPTLIQNPLLRPPDISWSTRVEMVVVERDKDDQAITNSAGMPFDPPLEEEERIAVLTVVKNLARYDGIGLLDYIGRTNHATWLGKPAGRWRLADATADRVIEEGIAFWRARLVFEYRAKGWAKKVLDAGYMQLNGDGSGWLPCIDQLGNPVSRPVPLDGFGYQADPTDDPHFITFYLHDEANFANLKPFK